MNLLFVHDHKFRFKNGKYYSNGGLNDEALSRYTNVFETITVLTRVIDAGSADVSKLSEITNPCVKIVDRKTLGLKETKRLIDENERVILRLPSLGGIIAYYLNPKKDFLVEVVGDAWDALWNRNIFGRILAPIFHALTKHIVGKSKWAIYVTTNYLQKRYPMNGKSIACSNVSLPVLESKYLEERIDKINEKKETDQFILGTTAAVDVVYKSQDVVIKAIAYLKEKGDRRFLYQMVGGGDPSRLQQLANKLGVEDQIEFIGSLPHDRVFDWLRTLDLYIQPSKQEGLPRALIEGMSVALPCMGSTTAGIPELLDNKYIFSNRKDNYLEVAKLLSGLTKNDMATMAQQNFNTAKEYEKQKLEERRRQFLIEYREG